MVLLMRTYTTGRERNSIESPTLLASYTARLEADDSTKIVVLRNLAEPVSEPPDMRTYGGGNATPGGVEWMLGENPQVFTAAILKSPQQVIKALKQLSCEKLSVILIDEYGQMGMLAETTGTPSPTTTYYPIPIQNFYATSKGLGGYEAPDRNNVGWSFVPDWSDDFVIIEPAFNPLFEL